MSAETAFRDGDAPAVALPLAIVGAMAALAVVLVGVNHGAALRHLAAASPAVGYDAERMVTLYATLPRLAMCILCGAALGASGALVQQVLRNPLAAPTTLGFDAGARLALTATTLFLPSLFGWGRDLVALSGSAVAAGAVFLLTRRQGFAPVPLVLAGLVVSLYGGALSAILTLLNERYLLSLFIWGGGSLEQQGWSSSIGLGARLLPLFALAALLVRPLQLLELGEAGAQALGLHIARLRLLAVSLSIACSAFVASAVGIIGFVGLVAPVVARLSGARRMGARLALSTIFGALLLLLTDEGVQLALGDSSAFVPTGAVTALLGAPLLLSLLPRLRAVARPAIAAHPFASPPGGRTLRLVVPAFILVALASVFVGRGLDGEWILFAPSDLADAMPWRGPRLVATFAAGTMLAIAGAILQRLTGNELAGPEVLGIGAGATLAVALGLFLSASIGWIAQSTAAFAGALAVLAFILALSRRSGFQPERVLLTGIALNALLDAFVGVMSASGDPRAVQLLAWMSGSPIGVDWTDALLALGTLAVAGAAACLLVRWLAVIPLGDAVARELGVPLDAARLAMLLVAAALTASATPILGPLSFLGLMAPHVARTLGLRRPPSFLLGAALAGGGLATVADVAARTIAFPYQLPTGLLAALVGTPVLMVLVSRRPSA